MVIFHGKMLVHQRVHQIQWCLMIFIGFTCLNIIFPIMPMPMNWSKYLHQTWRRGAISLAKYPRPGHRSSRGLEWVPCSTLESCPRRSEDGNIPPGLLPFSIREMMWNHVEPLDLGSSAFPLLRPYMAEDGEYFCNFQQGVRAGLSRHSLSKRTVSFFCSYEWKNQLQGTWHNPVQEWQTELAVRQQALWDQHHPLKVPQICVKCSQQIRCFTDACSKALQRPGSSTVFFWSSVRCGIWICMRFWSDTQSNIVYLYGLYNIVDIYIYNYIYIHT